MRAPPLLQREVADFGGELLAIILFTLGGVAWLLVPFFDRQASQEKKSPMFTAFGLFVLAFLLINTYRVYDSYVLHMPK